jgi:hypothetical protein
MYVMHRSVISCASHGASKKRDRFILLTLLKEASEDVGSAPTAATISRAIHTLSSLGVTEGRQSDPMLYDSASEGKSNRRETNSQWQNRWMKFRLQERQPPDGSIGALTRFMAWKEVNEGILSIGLHNFS